MSKKEKIVTALSKIGNTNGTAPPESQDPIVGIIHEYHTATLGESHYKARREKAKKKLNEACSDVHTKQIDKAIVRVKSTEQGDTISVFETEPYIVQLELKNGASYLDVPALKVTLARKHKLTTDQIEALIDECTDRRDPSQSWKVVER